LEGRSIWKGDRYCVNSVVGYLLQRRCAQVPLPFDNTVYAIDRGDYPVSTLLNGNFDMGDYSATLSLDASLQVAPTGKNSSLDLSFSTIVPGWSLHGGSTPLAGALVTHNQIKADHGANFTQGGGNGGRDFALKLGGGSA
jgi:hypothetical protein